ncbi:hypothetical protein BJV78DRAFT_1154874 [Lactifluus subvellereus]|nr:hypothetical protein BJV78DRAFT_1154874 [Lactifluus subvellereus]
MALIESLAVAHAYDISQAWSTVTIPWHITRDSDTINDCDPGRGILKQSSAPKIVFCSKDRASCLYAVLTFRGPGEKYCPWVTLYLYLSLFSTVMHPLALVCPANGNITKDYSRIAALKEQRVGPVHMADGNLDENIGKSGKMKIGLQFL